MNCVLCLRSVDSLIDENGKCLENNVATCLDIIFQCFGVTLASNMKATIICHVCSMKIEACYELKNLVAKAQKRFQDLNSNTNNSNALESSSENCHPNQKNATTTDATNSLSKRRNSGRAAKRRKDCRLPYKLDRNKRKCDYCDATFVFFADLQRHIPSHFPENVCEKCGVVCPSRYFLKEHLKTHESGRINVCPQCGNTYKKKHTLTQHIRTAHSYERPVFRCRTCRMEFGSYTLRIKHMVEAHAYEDRRYRCELCPKRFQLPGTLSTHVRRVHARERNFKCERCDAEFFTKRGLLRHVMCHTGERNYECDVCRKSYARKYTLTEHMKSHFNVRDHVCGLCGRSFVHKCALKRHMSTHARIDAMTCGS